MVKITEIEPTYCKISGSSIHNLTIECIKRIRSQSKHYYEKELLNDLNLKGCSLIDRHAGNGIFYKVILKSHSGLNGERR